jgi:hypothetical protein
MPYKVTRTTTIPVDAPKFDEWFDRLPVDYFANYPHSNGKNKFELLEAALDPDNLKVVVPQDAILINVPTPLYATETEEVTETETRQIIVEIWESKLAYRTATIFNGVFFNNADDVSNSLISMEFVDWEEIQTLIDPDNSKITLNSDGTFILNWDDADWTRITDLTGWATPPILGIMYAATPNKPRCSIPEIYNSIYFTKSVTKEET